MCKSADYCVKCKGDRFNKDGQCLEECDAGYNLVPLLNFKISEIYDHEVVSTHSQAMMRGGVCYEFLKYLADAIGLIQNFNSADGSTAGIWTGTWEDDFDFEQFGGLLGIDGSATGSNF